MTSAIPAPVSQPDTPPHSMRAVPTSEKISLDVLVTRGAMIESRHRVHAAIVAADGTLLQSARDPMLRTWWRSCAKPFQVLPMVAEGSFDTLGWGSDELAMACASHGGEPEHVAVAAAMLARVGLEEGDLACGAHDPLSARGARLLRESGQRQSRLHNNCSGKHAAMLARASVNGWSTRGYERIDHPVQVSARQSVAEWSDMPSSEVQCAVDGCGIPVFGLPLANMALSFARLATAARRGDDAPARVVSAMTMHPFLVGGTDRFDTVLMEALDGKVLCKIGAEGVHTLALLESGIGIALKVEDGTQRAQYQAVLTILNRLGMVDDVWPESFRDLAPRIVRNTRGEQVGEILVGDSDVGSTI